MTAPAHGSITITEISTSAELEGHNWKMKQSLVYVLVVTKNMWSMLIIRNAELADWSHWSLELALEKEKTMAGSVSQLSTSRNAVPVRMLPQQPRGPPHPLSTAPGRLLKFNPRV